MLQHWTRARFVKRRRLRLHHGCFLHCHRGQCLSGQRVVHGKSRFEKCIEEQVGSGKVGKKVDHALVTWVSQAKRLKVWTKMWDNDYRWLFPTFLVSDYNVSCALPEISWNGPRNILCRLDDLLMETLAVCHGEKKINDGNYDNTNKSCICFDVKITICI